MVKLSNRLWAVASLVSEGNILADVGTDHGYIPIYLLEQKKIPKAIAMDINEGPLERAKEHITLFGMEGYIETRRSDGVAALSPGEADTILIAGMGGGLILHILKEGKEVCRQAKELVLQPQSEIPVVRSFLRENGYGTLEEDMVCEDGKFYPMMRVRYQGECETQAKKRQPKTDALEKLEDLYGALLLQQKHPVLKDYLQKEQELYLEISKNLKKNPDSERVKKRLAEVEEILHTNQQALAYYKE